MSAEAKAMLGFALAMLILLAIGVLSYNSVRTLDEQARWREHTYEVLNTITSISSDLDEAETSQRGYILTGRSSYLGPYNKVASSISGRVAELRKLVSDNPHQLTRVSSLEAVIDARLRALADTIALRKRSGADAAMDLLSVESTRNLMDKLRETSGDMMREEQELLSQRTSTANTGERTAVLTVVAGTLAAILITISALLIMRRDVALRKKVELELRTQSQVLESRSAELVAANEKLSNELIERLRAEDERDRFFTLSQDLICVATMDGCFKRLNPAFERLLGYSIADLTSRPLIDFIHPLDVAATLAELKQLSAGNPTLRFENRYRCKDGSYKWLAWTSTPVPATGLIYASARDVSERRALEESLKHARDEAVMSAKLKAEFLANMSHEIRTPMNGIIGMTGLMMDTGLNAEQKEFVGTINSCGNALLTLINDILDFSKIEAGKMTLEISDFDLRQTVEEAIDLLAELAQRKKLEIGALIHVGVPSRLRGDAGRLRQVLINLIGNAVKFTEKGEIVVRVSVEQKSETHAALRFAVSDTGIGISELGRQRLFEPFNQADGSTTRKYGGTGLGLAISKQLVALMGGEIGLETKLGKGSEFWFVAQFERQIAIAGDVVGSVDIELNGLRVLVVDDSDTSRSIVRQQLASLKMHVAEAADGAQALDILRRAAAAHENVALAILDLQMPNMDGLEVAREIKADPLISKTRLLLMTSRGRQNEIEFRSAGISACIAKPVKQSVLFDGIANAMLNKNAVMVSPLVEERDAAPQLHSIRILLAEDNPVNQRVMLGQLQKLGYSADSVASGAEALERLSIESYDMVLMDCQMPVMDGYQATAEIRRREAAGEAKRIPIIAITAHAMEGDRQTCIRAGMDDYVSKPVDVRLLKTVLARWDSVSKNDAAIPLFSSPAETAASAFPVDLDRLKETVGDNATELRELLSMYESQTAELLDQINAAIEKNAAERVAELAHRCVGSSATLGMVSILPAMRELEKNGKNNALADAALQMQNARDSFERMKEFLSTHMTFSG